MILELEITKENTYVVADNKDTTYVYGIGYTNYTVHSNADMIQSVYNCRNLFRNMSTLDKNNHHVILDQLSHLLDDIEWKSKISYEGNTYNVVDTYIGIKGRCKVVVSEKGLSRDLSFKGEDLRKIDDTVKYIVTLET